MEARHAVLIPWLSSRPGFVEIHGCRGGCVVVHGLVQPAGSRRRAGRDRQPSPDQDHGWRANHLPSRIEAELSAGLPADPGQAEAIAQRRLREGKETLQRRLGAAYQGVTDAWDLGVAKVPAVVVDRRYVVYGEPDVARAVARIDAYRSTRP